MEIFLFNLLRAKQIWKRKLLQYNICSGQLLRVISGFFENSVSYFYFLLYGYFSLLRAYQIQEDLHAS